MGEFVLDGCACHIYSSGLSTTRVRQVCTGFFARRNGFTQVAAYLFTHLGGLSDNSIHRGELHDCCYNMLYLFWLSPPRGSLTTRSNDEAPNNGVVRCRGRRLHCGRC